MKILVLGYIVRGPIAGMTWHHIQYVIGLNNLGHDVTYYEDSGDTPYCCYNPETGITGKDPFYGLSYLENLFKKLDLKNNWIYFDKHENRLYSNKNRNGSIKKTKFDLLINLSVSNPIRDWMENIPARVLIDTDPVFTQIRNLCNWERNSLSAKHNVFFTFGENINSIKSTIPRDGFDWHTTRQPIIQELWLNRFQRHNGKFTSVLQWESYPSVEYNGIRYGVKSDSFVPYFDLPIHTSSQLEIALGSPNAPRKKLIENRWKLINPLEISKDPWHYQHYIQRSKAEFSIAKEAYVKSLSGWFSERSASYLAGGRPVIAQETGFSEWIETGQGLLSFTSPDEALLAIAEINGNYKLHRKKAIEVANAYFNAQRILEAFVELSMNEKG